MPDRIQFRLVSQHVKAVLLVSLMNVPALSLTRSFIFFFLFTFASSQLSDVGETFRAIGRRSMIKRQTSARVKYSMLISGI